MIDFNQANVKSEDLGPVLNKCVLIKLLWNSSNTLKLIKVRRKQIF